MTSKAYHYVLYASREELPDGKVFSDWRPITEDDYQRIMRLGWARHQWREGGLVTVTKAFDVTVTIQVEEK